jgi:hypothetical protein
VKEPAQDANDENGSEHAAQRRQDWRNGFSGVTQLADSDFVAEFDANREEEERHEPVDDEGVGGANLPVMHELG